MPTRRKSPGPVSEPLRYTGSGPTGVSVRVEPERQVTILNYSGRHACLDGDHEYDQQVRDHVTERVAEGYSGFLFDVRELEVVYPSGLGDLLKSWEPATKAPRVRVAILWDPAWRPRDRLPMWFVFAKARKGGHRILFRDEERALTFLRSAQR